MSYRETNPVLVVIAWIIGVLAAISILIGVVYVYKKGQVWMASQSGQAELTRAEFSAKANAALSDSPGGPEAYLRYLYIRMLEEQGNAGAVIYIPTEAGMPILEANRLK